MTLGDLFSLVVAMIVLLVWLLGAIASWKDERAKARKASGPVGEQMAA